MNVVVSVLGYTTTLMSTNQHLVVNARCECGLTDRQIDRQTDR
jgi:hypothetical protein